MENHDKTDRCLLLVDDEQNILLALKRELHQWAHANKLEILMASSAKAGLEILLTRAPDTALIISDLKMPEMKGSDFLLKVKDDYPDIVTILLTGYSETEEIVKAVSAGIFSFMLKPWDSAYLLAEVQKAFSYGEMRLQNARYLKLVEEQLKWAGDMQRIILKPNLPNVDGIEFRVSYRPIPGLYCSGDYYDVIPVGKNRYLLLIGDVAGNGLKASFVTAMLKAMIYPEYIHGLIGKQISPGHFLSWLNNRIQFEFRSVSEMLITFFAGVIDTSTGYFIYANAGHTHPCLISGGKVTELPIAGYALGFGVSTLYSENAVTIQETDLLFLYTDGLSGVSGSVPIPQLLKKVPLGQDFHQKILEASLAAGNAEKFTDDVTILTARRIRQNGI